MDPLLLLAIGALVVVGSILGLRLHAFLALLLGALVVAWLTPAPTSVGERLAVGFGDTARDVGILIALASIIGKAVLDSGAANRIVRWWIRVLGERQAPLAFIGAGFVLGIPVFFDTVLLLLLPLAKAMAARKESNYLLYLLSAVAGATMAHSLVPPTPGPIMVASMLHVDLGAMMLGGIFVGTCASCVGYLYARWANRRFSIPLRPTPDLPQAELDALASEDDNQLPPLWLAALPILLPVLLISAKAIATSTLDEQMLQSRPLALVSELGNKNIALAIGAAVALATLVYQKRTSAAQLSVAMQAALASAGVVILITSAGGAFGDVLEQTGVGSRIQQLADDYHVAILPLAFLVTALVRTAQGSATVAMITAGGIFQGFVTDPAALGFHPVYLALAIGCGSKPFPWMNDSGFWLIGRMGGLTEGETLKTASTMLSLMGVAGLLVVLVLARLLPMPLG